MTRIKDKVVLVTGGAGGLGAAFARALVAEGAKVVVGDVADDEGKKLVAEFGESAHYIHLDVTDPASWAQAITESTNTFGRLDGLVNNAGIGAFGTLVDTELADWNRVLEVNLTGAFLGMRAATPALLAAGGGSIVNISSLEGIQGGALMHAYVASKFGIRGLTKSAALELASQGVRVNSLHPGLINTPLTENLPDDFVSIPMGRCGEPAEVASYVVFLISDDSSYTTGAEFVMDGGIGAGIQHKFA